MKATGVVLTVTSAVLAACSGGMTGPTKQPEPSMTSAVPPTENPMAAEKVTFTTQDGAVLSGTLRGTGEFAVVLAHQGTLRADQNTWAAFAELLAQNGIASLAFDFRGKGLSGGTFLTADLDKDVEAATRLLQTRGHQKIVCAGASMGGTACMSAAQREDYAGLIVLASGMSAGTGQYGLHLTEEDVAALKPPKLFITGEKDFGVLNDMKRMAELASEPKELVILPGTKHGTDLFDTEAGPALTAKLLEFLDAVRDGTLTAGGQGASMRRLEAISAENADRIELLKTLEIPGFERGSLSQCSVAFSPDEWWLSGVCYRNTIPVWDAESGELAREMQSTPTQEVAAAFSPDGKLLATGGLDKQIRVWDAASGELRESIGPLPTVVWDLAFSPDGAKLAAAGFDISGSSDEQGIRMWGVESGYLLWEYGGSEMPVRALSVAFAPDGETLAAGTFDNVLVLDAETGDLHESLEVGNHVGDVAFSLDGERLAAGSDDSKIHVWDTYDYEPLTTLEGHKGYVNGVAFTPDSYLLISGSHDQEVGVWDVESGRLLKMLEGHEAPVLRVAVNPVGTVIASVSWDGTVRLWGVPE
jgi:pimeloyl-ACP methyl ester carboxylesterase